MLASMGRRLLLACLVFILTAAAVEPVYRVDGDTLFIPADGVAIDAHNGHVLWRHPRFTGQTFTDGHGLVLISWMMAAETALHRRYTRFCRVSAANGKNLWCRDYPDAQQWTTDANGQLWYLHATGRLDVMSIADGKILRTFGLDEVNSPSEAYRLMPLPGGGALVMAHGNGRTLTYRPGATALVSQELPSAVYPFLGTGSGLLLYAREKGEFFLAAPLKALFRFRSRAPEVHSFPRATLDSRGFVFTDWQGTEPVLRGGTYDGQVWQVPRQSGDAELALASSTAVLLAPSQIAAWDRSSGAPRFAETLPAEPRALHCQGDDLVLVSNSDVRLLDAATGNERWRVYDHEGPLAAIAATTVDFWEDAGTLIGLDLSDGTLLWRIRFKL
ncbi:MAG TPA: PQQ-binding-like beta-propeller repeat protein [Terriglobales bacterium]|nr:PQQ-binding-like beta-propeller repeat protein [Terriglobales bacterium]